MAMDPETLDLPLGTVGRFGTERLIPREEVARTNAIPDDVADRAPQIFGGTGYMAERPVKCVYLDLRLVRVFDGTTRMQQLVIDRDLVKAG